MKKTDELMVRKIIRSDTYQAHLVEAVIRQILAEGDAAKIIVIRKREKKKGGSK